MMEDYEEFAANRLSELRSPADPPSAPGRLCGHRSLIRFHGRCVLPPLLSGERREEMRTLKEHLKKPSDRSESAASGLVDRVRHILHSVQLRKAPTLQEFFEEKSGLPPLSPPSSPHEVPPLTSTTYSGMSRSPPPPHSQPLLDPPGGVSQRPQSSGDGTHNVMGRADWARESRVEGGTSLGGFLLCSPSNRAAMTPDIISHPPIDGEKLERSAMDTSIEDCLIANDMLTEVCSAEPDHKQSVIGSLSAESGPPVGHLVTCVPLGTAPETNHGVRAPSAQGDSYGRRDTGCGQEGPGPTVEAGPEVTLSPATTPPLQVLGGSSRPPGEPGEPGEPYRLSLQALLKKSQECRQQQRALRNQARPGRVVPERDRGTEESLSDKENQEVPHKAPHKAPQRRSTKHTIGDPPADTALNKWGKDEQEGSQVEDLALKGSTDEFTTSHNTNGLSSTGRANSESLDLGGRSKTIPENIPPALSPGGAHEASSNPVEASALPPEGSAPAPRAGGTLRGVSDPQRGGGYHVLPSPVLCTSPVHCKSRGLHEGGHAHPEPGAHNGHSRGQPGAQPVQGGGPAGLALSRSSAHTQQMDQLELNLSGLKLLISELESTITENMRNQAPPGDPPHGGHSLSGEGRPGRDNAWTGGPTDEDTDPELWDFIDLPYFRPHRGGDGGGGSHGSPGQAPARGLARGSAAGGGGGGSPSAQGAPGARGPLTCSRIPQPSAKRPSVSPRPLIPEAFWEIQPVRVQSDSSNQPFRVQSDSSNQPFRVQSDSSNQPVRVQSDSSNQPFRVQSDSSNQPVRVQSDSSNQPFRVQSDSSNQPVRAQSDSSNQPFRVQSDSSNQPFRVQSDSSNQPVRVQSDSSNQPVRVQSDSSNQPVRGRPPAAVAEGDPLNRSYDVERPSGLWRLDPSGSGAGSYLSPVPDHKRRTPESEGGAGGQGGVSKAKRRLLMHAEQAAEERRRGRLSYASPPNASPPGRGAGGDPGDELKLAHAAQWRALQAEQGVQQQHLLQALSERCRLLQRVSSLCPPSVSWPGDAATLSGGGVLSDVCFQLPLPAAPPLQSVGRSLPERWRPLVAAAVKGFLTRRLLRTGRVQQLRRTARDTQQFLQAFENQSPGGREGLCSRQDGLLWERVTLQLRSVRYEIHDVFFRLTAAEKMQLIRWDRELKQQTGPPGRVVGKSSLSAATQKSLERKRRLMMQQKVPDRPWVRGAQGPHLRGPPTPQRRPGQLRTSRPQRGPKTSRTGRR
ncbi:uncharacterized protein si:ch73-100l22.3 [Gadus chalcogrammus]|uniref:uncharacterized protein si:ch73-100l22.3 n=1 Tax=Gadus chalcogrammus TaxID=1042646 RepID=UPI0024C32DC1|nr:uncharacterized protein si:ch73-100l22.3 [Gadus chalcogrammus]